MKERPQEPEDDLIPLSEQPGYRNLHPKIVEDMVKSELQGGANLNELEVGRSLKVTIENSIYIVERRDDGLYISGHPKFCPEPTKVDKINSTWGGNMAKTDYIGRDMFMEFSVPIFPVPEGGKKNKRILTSEVQEVKESPQ